MTQYWAAIEDDVEKRMDTKISEIADGIYRLSTYVPHIAPPAGFTFNQFLVLGNEPLMFHAEVVSRNDRPMGYVRSASYGWTLGGAVGLAMIEADQAIDQKYLNAGRWTVRIAGTDYPAIASLRPLYDPASERIRM